MPRRGERPFKRGAVNQNRWCSSMAEQLICNQQVGGSTPFTSSIFMGEFPSGQRGQTVNLLSLTSVVRIHLPPPDYVPDFTVRHIFLSIHAGLRNKNKNGFLFARRIVAVRSVFTAYFMKSVCQRR